MARNRGQQTERRVLKEMKARRQPGSGSIPGFPNDGVKNAYLIEVKSTERKSLSIKHKWLDELQDNAMLSGKTPALVIVFNINLTTQHGGFHAYQEWVAVPRMDFERLTKGWKTT